MVRLECQQHLHPSPGTCLSISNTDMKTFAPLVLSILATFGPGLHARETPAQHESDYRAKESFTEFRGVPVWSQQGEKVGIVQDMTVDLQNARLVEVLVRSGGFLGIGAQTRSVAPKALHLDFANRVLRLDVTKANFLGAPRVNPHNTASFSDRQRVAATLRYFGLQPWFYMSGEAAIKNAETLKLGHVERATHLLAMPVINSQGDSVGRVNALTMDMPKGQVTHVIVKNSLETSERRVVQPRALRFNDAGTVLILDDSFVGLPNRPHFQWVDGSRTSFRQESYVNREVLADDGLHSRQNASAGIVNRSIPMEEGDSFRDEKKTRQINELIRGDASLSRNALDIEVATLNAQTTLRGHVRTEATRRKIGQLAEKYWRSENVSNLLEVRPD